MTRAKALPAVLAVFAAACIDAAAQPQGTSCAAGDKACAMKAAKQSRLLDSGHWAPALRKPLRERIEAAPPDLVGYLELDAIVNGIPNKPRAASPDAAFMADARRAFDEIPAPVKRLLEPRLAGIYFAEDIGGTGFTEATSDGRAGFIVLDHTVLARQTANAWATWKDSTPFRPDPAWRLETRIAAAADDNRMRAIQYILLHEIGHVLSIGEPVHPPWNVDPKGIDPSKYYFFGLSWSVREGRYASRFDAEFPKRRDVRFYFGAKLDAVDMLPVYEALEKTSFPTLYAATHPADDFAESFASYVHVVMMGRDHEVRLYRQGKLAKAVGPCWGQARCAYKRTALESALKLPVTR